MKKLTVSDVTSKYFILAAVFALIYAGLLVTGFGVNGELSPSGGTMIGVIISGVCFVIFGTKASNEIEKKHNSK